MKIFLFGGTTEGRLLAADLAALGASVTVSVATPLGAEELANIPGLTVLTGRMEVPAMAAALAGQDLCVDATHPYAAAASANIRAACEEAGIQRLRLARPQSELPEDIVLLPDAQAAARFLAGQAGNILLATGANTVGCYRELASRVWARVLPTTASLAACEAAGLAHSHILALQGPFSRAFNEAMLREYRIAWLVTKDGGKAGGFADKAQAARAAGARLVVLGRPASDGPEYTYEEVRERCREMIQCRSI